MSIATMLSIGKLRGLQQISFANGLFAMVAIDHRESLQRLIDPSNPQGVSYHLTVEVKSDVVAALGPWSSGVLLDAVFGAGQVVVGGALPREAGLIATVEASGYAGDQYARLNSLVPHWGVAKAKRMGASAIKLLVQYRREAPMAAARQVALVERVMGECREHDIAAVGEALSYPVAGESAADYAQLKPRIVMETAQDLTGLGMDVFKAEFPADMRVETDDGKLLAHCEELDRACRVPWVVLSAGVDFEVFCRQVEIACRAGASGFLAGRAIWQEAVSIRDGGQRRHYLQTTGVDRMRRLSDIAGAYGRPWTATIRPMPVSQDWFVSY